MKSCETFEELQALGVDQIHEKTHISRDKIELLLNKSYGGIGPVQFMGFVSILERDFGIDLSDIRAEYAAYRQIHTDEFVSKASVVLQPSSNTKQKWVLAGLAVIVALLAGGYFLQSFLANEPGGEVMQLESLNVKPPVAVEENATVGTEANTTAESNLTQSGATGASALPSSTASAAGKVVTIRPFSKVWVGTIDMGTGARFQQVTGEPIVIDATKTWLIFLGQVEIETQQGKEVMHNPNPVRFLCENGTFRALSRSEFAERNGGKNW